MLCCLFLLLRWCSIAWEFGMRSEYQQQYWQLLPGTALQLFIYSICHLNHCHSLTKEWLCNPVFQWIQNKPENCRLIPALQEQHCALSQLTAFPVFNEHLVTLTKWVLGHQSPENVMVHIMTTFWASSSVPGKPASYGTALPIQEPGIRFKTDTISSNQRCFSQAYVCCLKSKKVHYSISPQTLKSKVTWR